MAPLFIPAFQPIDSPTLHNIGLSASVNANALTINLVSSDGSSSLSPGNPGYIGMRSSTATSGAFNLRSVTGPVSITVPSSATLGMAASSNTPLCVYALDNAGTIALGVSFVAIPETGGTINTTAISSSALFNYIIFSNSNLVGVPYRIIGLITCPQVTPGTWVSSPTKISLVTPYTKLPTLIARYRVGTSHSITNNANTTIIYDTVNIDSYNCVSNPSTTSWAFNCPLAGHYSVQASILFDATSWTGTNQGGWCYVYKNGSDYNGHLVITTGASTWQANPNNADVMISANVTDTIQIVGLQNSGASTTYSNGNHSFVDITYLGA